MRYRGSNSGSVLAKTWAENREGGLQHRVRDELQRAFLGDTLWKEAGKFMQSVKALLSVKSRTFSIQTSSAQRAVCPKKTSTV